MRSLSLAQPLTKLHARLHSIGHWKYHAAFLMFVFLMSWRSVLTKQIIGDLDGLLLTFLTALFAMLFAAALRTVNYGTHLPYDPRPLAPYFITLGFSTLAGMAGTNAALAHMPPVVFALTEIILYPAMVSLLAAMVGKGESICFGTLIPVLLVAFTGITLFSFQNLDGETGSIAPQGFVFLVIGVMGWATSIVMVSNLVRAGVPVLDVISYRFMGTVIVLGSYLALAGKLRFDQYLPEIILLAFFGFVLPFIFSFSGVKKVSVVTYALYTMLTPITTYSLSLLMLDNQKLLTPLQIVGAFLIFAAVGFRTANEVRQHRRHTTMLIRQRVQ